uniref:Uncharacterized protein n=1 Tax=Trichogramma kaykai TaxID=54128 RepID=A0ABD2W1L0_9HYME
MEKMGYTDLFNHDVSNNYQIQNKIKKETVDEVKKEVNLNFDCELNEENEKRNDTEKLKDSLKMHTKKLPNGTSHTCDTCGKTYTTGCSQTPYLFGT